MSGAIIAMTAFTALVNFAGVATAFKASRQAVGVTLLTGVQSAAKDSPAGCPEAVETIRSVRGVMFTVCPAAVAMELSVT